MKNNNHHYILDVVEKPYATNEIDEAFDGKIVEHILFQESDKLGIFFKDNTCIVITHENHQTYDSHYYNKMKLMSDLDDDEKSDFGLITGEELKIRNDEKTKEYYESHKRGHSHDIKHMLKNHGPDWVQEQIAKWTEAD